MLCGIEIKLCIAKKMCCSSIGLVCKYSISMKINQLKQFFNSPSLAKSSELDTMSSLDLTFSSLMFVPSKNVCKTSRISQHFKYNGPENSHKFTGET